MKANRVVMLIFDSGPRVDIAANATEPEALAAMISRAMLGEHPPRLPLHAATTAVIPDDRLRELLGDAERPQWTEPVPQPAAVPIAGLRLAMRSYAQRDVTGAKPEALAEAQAELRRFFDHYGVSVDFTDGASEWSRKTRKTPADIWTGDAK